MNDTSPWAAARMAALFADRDAGERVAMAAGMFATARALQIAGLLDENPASSDTELRLKLLERTYRADFSPEQWDRLLARWRQHEE